jgi:peptidoglycan hydrolase CwlO-like protein
MNKALLAALVMGAVVSVYATDEQAPVTTETPAQTEQAVPAAKVEEIAKPAKAVEAKVEEEDCCSDDLQKELDALQAEINKEEKN